MSRDQFMNELVVGVQRLPAEERHAAISYYEEYFDEAGKENEEEAINALGAPSQIAKQLLADSAIKESETTYQSPKKSISALWFVLLAIFAAPIALPIAISLVALIFAGIVTICALVFALGTTGISFIIAGFTMFIGAIPYAVTQPSTGLFGLGIALACIGVALLVGMLVYYIMLKGIPVLTRATNKLLKKVRRGK